MVAFESLVDHGLDFALFIQIFLGGVGIKQIIEVELSEGIGLLPDVDFVFILVDFDEAVLEALFFLWGKEGTDSDCGFDFAGHLIKK